MRSPLTLSVAFTENSGTRRPYRMTRRTAGGGSAARSSRSGTEKCCRHAIVGTSILRANKIPARTVCGLWAIDNQSKGGHCWGEFFLAGVGWVPYDTTIDSNNSRTETYFGTKKGEVLAGMVDFDWVVDAGPFGKQTVFGIDAFPAFWSEGQGDMDESKLDATESVRILRGSR